MDKRAIIVTALVLAVMGMLAAQTRTAAPASPQGASYQRFVPMPRLPENLTNVPWSGAFALDTKTGQSSASPIAEVILIGTDYLPALNSTGVID